MKGTHESSAELIESRNGYSQAVGALEFLRPIGGLDTSGRVFVRGLCAELVDLLVNFYARLPEL
jgi:hypothetical protein